MKATARRFVNLLKRRLKNEPGVFKKIVLAAKRGKMGWGTRAFHWGSTDFQKG